MPAGLFPSSLAVGLLDGMTAAAAEWAAAAPLLGTVAVATLLLIGRLSFQRGLRRRLHSLGAEHARQEERLRVARELHDGLGSGFGRLLLTVDRAGRQTNLAELERLLAEACATARELAAHSRDLVWAVSPEHDSLEHLLARLAETVHADATAVGATCRLDLPVEVPALPVHATTRHRVLRVARAALHATSDTGGLRDVALRAQRVGDRAVVELACHGRLPEGPWALLWRERLDALDTTAQITALPDGIALRFHFDLSGSSR